MATLPLTPVDIDLPWVALDLETTGLDSRKDRVIEIGAVKFVGDQVLDTLQTFVDPRRRLSAFRRTSRVRRSSPRPPRA